MNIRVVIVLLLCCIVLLAGYTAVMAFVAENALPPLLDAWLDWLLNDVLGVERLPESSQRLSAGD